MMFVFLLALVIFGPTKIPELGRNLGKALTEFRKTLANQQPVSLKASAGMAGFIASGLAGWLLLALGNREGTLGFFGFLLVVLGVVGIVKSFF